MTLGDDGSGVEPISLTPVSIYLILYNSMNTLLRAFLSIRLAIVLCVLICIVSVWGSFVTVRNPSFFQELDRQILLPWLVENWREHLSLILWILILIVLVGLFAINTTACTVEKIYSVAKRQRPWQSLFPHIVHIGFLIALAGHLVGSIWGFRSYGNILLKGYTVKVPYRGDIHVRLDDLYVSTAPDGRLESLRTRISLMEKGRVVLTDDIQFNDPVIYKGIAFYYASHGLIPTGIVVDMDGRIHRARFGGYIDREDGLVLGRIRGRYVEIISGRGETALLDLSMPGATTTIDGRTVRLVDYIMEPYVVLTINRDPGIWFIIVGSGVLTIGIVLLLFFRGERSELVKERYHAGD